MGRKSDGGDEGGGGGGARVMGLRVIQCGRQTVHVVQPDGQARQFVVPVKVSDVLQFYPHHFISHAPPGVDNGVSGTGGLLKRSSGILPLDTYLETGNIYVLHPYPRLFSFAPLSTPHFCSCYFPVTAGGLASAIKSELKRRFLMGNVPSAKISPEDRNAASGCPSLVPRRTWEPDLETISEEKVLNVVAVTGEDEVIGKTSENWGKSLVSSTLQNLGLS